MRELARILLEHQRHALANRESQSFGTADQHAGGTLKFTSTSYGSDEFVSVRTLSGVFVDGKDFGQDATVNGVTIKKDAFVDPWGGEYLVSVDADYDGWTQDFIPYSDLTYTSKTGGSGTHPAVQATATSSSWGKDAKLGTNGDGKYKDSDDVISWQ